MLVYVDLAGLSSFFLFCWFMLVKAGFAGIIGFYWFMLFFAREHILVDEASYFSYLGFHIYNLKLGLVDETSIVDHFLVHWNV